MTDDELSARLIGLEVSVEAIVKALVEQNKFDLQQGKAKLAMLDDEKELILRRWTAFDNLAIRVERLEERFVALANALNEG